MLRERSGTRGHSGASQKSVRSSWRAASARPDRARWCRWGRTTGPGQTVPPASPRRWRRRATWTISTARSPTTWQPRIWRVPRSTISLQNPSGRPSMIGRRASNGGGRPPRRVAGASARSGRPGRIGVGEAAIGDAVVARGWRRGPDGVGRRNEAGLQRLRHQHHSSGHVSGGETCGGGGAQISSTRTKPRSELATPARPGSARRCRPSSPPHDRHHRFTRSPAWPSFESSSAPTDGASRTRTNAAEVLCTTMPEARKRRDCRRDILVLGGKIGGPASNSGHSGAELGEATDATPGCRWLRHRSPAATRERRLNAHALRREPPAPAPGTGSGRCVPPAQRLFPGAGHSPHPAGARRGAGGLAP